MTRFRQRRNNNPALPTRSVEPSCAPIEGLCEPAVGLMIVSDNVPTENASTSNIVAGSSVIRKNPQKNRDAVSEEKGGVYVHRTTGLGWPPAVAVVGRKDPTS
ncbi:hypothetical protein Tco_0607102 [Tanacetum coccineum]